MLPDTCASSNESAGRVPVNVSDTVVVGSVHELQVRGEILVTLWLLALEIHVKELHVEALLRVNGGNDDEASLGRPVDGITVFLVIRSDVLEVANTSSLDFLWAVE